MSETTNDRVKCASTLSVSFPRAPWEQQSKGGQLEWTEEFCRALSQGVRKARMRGALYRMMGPLSEMTKEELAKWTQHVRQGHLPYNKRCQTCVATKATGHLHRRVEAPSCFTLSVDVCGPFRVKGHTPEALDYRYMLVGSYTMPKLPGTTCDSGDVIVNNPAAGVGDIEVPGHPVDDVDQADMDRLNAEYQELVKEVGDKMDYQVLRYAVPMRSRRASEVNAGVRQMYLQVKADGLEVFRLHSDRATELCNRRLREWLLDRGVLATTGEAQTPQQNGRAEATVKFVKAEARLLMTTAQLPKQTWPLAMRYATTRQRHKALGRTDELPCFGTPVHVRTKIYGKAGKYDVDNKWAQGVYVGPSEDVQHGHVVRFPDGTFVTSLHLKQKLINADELVDLEPREVELPLPERRVRRKTRLARIQGEHPLTAEEEAAELKAKCLWKEGDWSMQAMLTLYECLQTARGKQVSGRAASSPGSSWYTGTFVHGG
ncbi:GIP, partial [Symbiodinium sp. CCMP2456]